MKEKNLIFLLFILSFAGVLVAGYLTYDHYFNIEPVCHINRFFPNYADCGKVLHSPYSVIFSIPLALIGEIYYFVFFFLTILVKVVKSDMLKLLLFIQSIGGFVASIYFVYLQIIVIGAICQYCMLSAFISFTIFYLELRYLKIDRIKALSYLLSKLKPPA